MNTPGGCGERCGADVCFLRATIEGLVETSLDAERLQIPDTDPHMSFLRVADEGLRNTCRRYGKQADIHDTLKALEADIDFS